VQVTQPTGATQTAAGAVDLAAPSPSPTRIGRYVVLGLLGRGGMGEVYLGLDEQLGRQIAIKVLSRPGEPARISDRLQREALALACLAHPNVVAIHEVGEAGGQVYLVMERVDGATLRGWLLERRRGVDEVLAVMLQAGRGLAAAHAAGLIHRDFKPKSECPPQTPPLPPSGRILADGGDLRGAVCRIMPRHAAVLATDWQRPARWARPPVVHPLASTRAALRRRQVSRSSLARPVGVCFLILCRRRPISHPCDMAPSLRIPN